VTSSRRGDEAATGTVTAGETGEPDMGGVVTLVDAMWIASLVVAADIVAAL